MTSGLRLGRNASVLSRLALVALGLALTLSIGGCPPPSNNNGNSNTNVNGNSNGNGNSNTNGNSNSNGNTNGNTNGNSNSNGNTNGNTNGNSNSNGNTNGNTNGNDNNSNGNTNGNTNGNSNSNGNTNDNGNDNVPPPASIALERVVKTGDAVPDQPNTAEFTEFGDPVIDEDGRVAFWAKFSGGNGNGGLYVWDGDAIEKVVDDNPDNRGLVPSYDANAFFGVFTDSSSFKVVEQGLSWGVGGRLLFSTKVAQPAASGVYRWRASDGNMIRVGDAIQVAALLPQTYPNGAAFLGTFTVPGVSEGGLGVFAVSYTYFTNPTNGIVSGKGLFTSNGNTVSILVDPVESESGDVPDQGNSGVFTSIDAKASMNRVGDVLLQSQYENGNSGTGGVYLARGGVLYRVIDNRTASNWPGLPANVRVGTTTGRYVALAIGPNTDVALACQINQNAASRDAVLIYNFTSGRWAELTPGNQQATSLLTGINDDRQVAVLANGSPWLVDADNEVRLDDTLPSAISSATISWEESAAGAINNSGFVLLRYRRAVQGSDNDAPGLILWTGEELLIIADDSANLPNLSGDPVGDLIGVTIASAPHLNRPGLSGAINGTGELVFRTHTDGPDGDVDTADDEQGIYIGRPE